MLPFYRYYSCSIAFYSSAVLRYFAASGMIGRHPETPRPLFYESLGFVEEALLRFRWQSRSPVRSVRMHAPGSGERPASIRYALRCRHPRVDRCACGEASASSVLSFLVNT